MNKLLTVGELLGDEQLPYDHHVLLPDEPKWELDARCAIVDADEVDDPEDHPLAVANDLTCSIGSNEVKGMIENARQQIAQPTLDQLLQALEYFADNDAFIDFSENA